MAQFINLVHNNSVGTTPSPVLLFQCDGYACVTVVCLGVVVLRLLNRIQNAQEHVIPGYICLIVRFGDNRQQLNAFTLGR